MCRLVSDNFGTDTTTPPRLNFPSFLGQFSNHNAAMKRSPRILVANLALIVLIAFLCFVLHPSEPTYQGRRLREWLINAAMTVVYPNANADAVKAIRHIGSNAVPTLR